jgi:reductive dehalogenase
VPVKLFSNRDRGFHLGPFPLERLARSPMPEGEVHGVRPPRPTPPAAASGLAAVLGGYLDLFLQFSDGRPAGERAPIALDAVEIANDLKAGGYFLDASMMACCSLPTSAWYANDADGNAFAPYHANAVVVLVEHGRPIEAGNLAHDWTAGADAAAGALRAIEIANVLAGYIRNLGWSARAHSRHGGDVNQDVLVVRSGLGERHDGKLVNPFIGTRFATAVVTTEIPLAPDAPLAATRPRDRGLGFWLGRGGSYTELARRAERRRPAHMSRYPMERIRKVAAPTTLILDDEVPRVSKRAAFFERALRGDLGEKSQAERTRFAVKHPFTFAMRSMQGAMVPLQGGDAGEAPQGGDAEANANAVKALCYWMGTDLVGICRIPDYAWYSHSEDGTPIEPHHRYAIVLLIDQGYETMEGASGDDWISGTQSMRGYMRGAEVTGVIAEHLRRLGHSARSQTNIDSEVLHIPLILNAGLGELSRIGELVLNPYVGPRFKSAVITTNMPLAVDKPIDFGLQDMCGKCNKCARECPCSAIPAGPKIMFNGYEIWKPDVERCARYRLTNPKGAACGRCMKTCPYNHEGLLAHRLMLWLAIHVPATRRWIARLDDKVGNGRRNLVKKWWRDLEWSRDGHAIEPHAGTNQRDIEPDKVIDPEKQKIAYYPASAMPVPDDTNAQPVVRKQALAAAALIETPEEARARVARGGTAPEHYRATPAAGQHGPAVAVGRSGLAEPEDSE